MTLRPPCPWCHKNQGRYAYTKDEAAGIDTTVVVCRQCRAQGPPVDSQQIPPSAARKAALVAWEDRG